MPYSKEFPELTSIDFLKNNQDLSSFFNIKGDNFICSPQFATSSSYRENLKVICNDGFDIILLVREPVDRVYSHLKMKISRGDISIEKITECLKKELMEYKCNINTNFENIDFENVFLGSDYKNLFMQIKNDFPNSKIKIFDIKNYSALLKYLNQNFGLGLSKEYEIRNSSDKKISLNYLQLVKYIKKISFTKFLWRQVPYRLKSAIFWKISSRFSLHNKKDIDLSIAKIKDSTLHKEINEILSESKEFYENFKT